MKIREKYYVLCIKGLLVLFFPIILNTYSISLVSALDSTPSADIKTKLEELKKEIASKAAKLKQEVSGKLRNKSFVGTVKHTSKTSFTLSTRIGPRIVSLNQDTEFESKRKSAKKASLQAVSEEDYIAALGDIDDTGVLTAKRIVLLPTPDSTPKAFLWGQIVASSNKLITLKDKDSKNTSLSLSDSLSVKVNDFIILTGRMSKDNIFAADFIYTIPKTGIIKPKKLATPSANKKQP